MQTLTDIKRLANELGRALDDLANAREVQEEEERYLTCGEVAAMLQVSDRWVRNHRKALGGFGSRKLLRFPLSKVKRWIERSRK